MDEVPIPEHPTKRWEKKGNVRRELVQILFFFWGRNDAQHQATAAFTVPRSH